MKRTFSIFLTALICLINTFAIHASPIGVSYTQLIIPKDPDHLNGLRAAITYQPSTLIWEHVQVYFDASYGYWWLNNNQPHHSLSSVALAPYLRYWLAKKTYFSPYVEISIAPAYITKTRLGDSNLGMHFIFQDQFTMGAAFGAKRKFYTALNLIHYSNASFCSHNPGITAPLLLTFGYQF